MQDNLAWLTACDAECVFCLVLLYQVSRFDGAAASGFEQQTAAVQLPWLGPILQSALVPMQVGVAWIRQARQPG